MSTNRRGPHAPETHKPTRAARPVQRKAPGRLYNQQRWRDLARSHLQRHPLCLHCLALDRTTSATCVDHIRPHRNDPALFWDEGNWQSLCDTCHGDKTAIETGRGKLTRSAPGSVLDVTVVGGPPGPARSAWAHEQALACGGVVLDPWAIACMGPGHVDYTDPGTRRRAEAVRATGLKDLERSGRSVKVFLCVDEASALVRREIARRLRAGRVVVVGARPGGAVDDLGRAWHAGYVSDVNEELA